MYDRDTVELFLMALDEGMNVARAGREVGIPEDTARRWAAGGLPHCHPGGARASGRIAGSAKPSKRRRPVPEASPYDPPKSGPLAGMTRDQIESLLLKAVLDDLKGEGSHPLSTPMRSRCELGERLRRATGLPTSEIIRFLEIPRSTWHCHRANPRAADPLAPLRPLVAGAFDRCGRRGYRAVHAELRRAGTRVSEKLVRRVMREDGLVARRRRRRRYSSYAGEVSPAPPNLPLRPDGTHAFRAARPNELWVTDLTEFRLPGDAGKACLNAVVDCHDGRPAGWAVGTSPDSALANESLERACAGLSPGERPVIHSDRGWRYRWPGWVSICERAGLVRSMSRKGMSCDNARAEGFFGLLKQEFFYAGDWSGVTAEGFMAALDAWLAWFRAGRISEALGWMTPDEYRLSRGYAL